MDDWRNYIVSPFTYAFGNIIADASNCIFQDRDIKQLVIPGAVGSTTDGTIDTALGVQGIYVGGIQTPLSDPGLFPYVTTTKMDSQGNPYIATLADLELYTIDVDMYIFPNKAEMTNVIIQDLDNYDPRTKTFDQAMQIHQNSSVNAKFYYERSHGNASSNYAQLQAERFITPSAPMRIKGTFLFADYPYSIARSEATSEAAALAAQVNPQLITTGLSNILASYPMPADSVFHGCNTNVEKAGGSLYQLNGMPTFQAASGVRYDECTHGDARTEIRRWRMTKGVVYNGLNEQFQMFFSPVAYPHSLDIGGGGTDYKSSLSGTNYDHGFTKHDRPMFLSPMLVFPSIDLVNETYPVYKNQAHTQVLTNVQNLTPLANKMTFESGTYTHSRAHSFWANPTNPFAGLSGFTTGTAVACPAGITCRTTSPYKDPVTSVPLSIAQDLCYQYFTDGIIQPRLRRGQVYIQEVNPEIACHSYDFLANSGNRGGTGRYKYCGFKGKIAWFEMPGQASGGNSSGGNVVHEDDPGSGNSGGGNVIHEP